MSSEIAPRAKRVHVARAFGRPTSNLGFESATATSSVAGLEKSTGSLPSVSTATIARPVLVGVLVAAAGLYAVKPFGWAEFLALQLSIKDLLVAALSAFLWLELVRRGRAGVQRGALERNIWVPAVIAVGTIGAAIFLTYVAGVGSDGVVIVTLWGASAAVALGVHIAPPLLREQMSPSPPRQVIIVGSGPRAQRVARELEEANPAEYQVLGFVDSNSGRVDPAVERRKLGSLDELSRILMDRVVDEVLIALPIKSHYAEIQRAIHLCERTGTESKYLADVFDCSVARPQYEVAGSMPLVAMKIGTDDYRSRVKRSIDIIGGLLGLVVLAPLMLLIAIAVKISSPGPILFAQERFGHGKRLFRMYKFRTMVPGAEHLQSSLEDQNEASGPVFKIRNDPRTTPLGRFLRRTSLDELPQLINVIRGDMSLVGPRPLPVRDVYRFEEPWLMRRFSVRPGLTCLWQVSGRNNVGFDDWVTMDLKYIDEWSLTLDFWIMARTIPAVIVGEGAS